MVRVASLHVHQITGSLELSLEFQINASTVAAISVFDLLSFTGFYFQNTQEVKNERFLISTRQNNVRIFGIRCL